ncbi:MAG: DEAD/DEAH box helicase family protein [Sphingomonadales bacterium]|jgi:superfamily II DNA or RNA helicase
MPSFSSWSDIEKHLADAGNHEKGELFEQLSEHLLTWDPKYQTLLKHVWRLKGTPTQVLSKLNIPQQDQGIDLIAETFDGKYWAIQCKYHGDADKNVTHREISTFLALSNTIASNISFCLVITTADDYARLYKGQNNMGFVLSNVWAELPETFYTDFGKKDKPAINTPRQPRKHQQKAIAEAVHHFQDEKRGKLIFPCGAGKSLTGYWISKALDAKHILVAVPSLALVKQTLDDYCRESLAEGNPIAPFCICSDEGIGKSDDVAIFSQDLGINCTTDREQIKEFLRQKTDRKKVIFTTYQSGRVLGEAIKEVAFSFDLGILDEAHKTVGAADKLFSYLLFDENVQIQKRIFMTATERRYKGSSDNILSMDDPEVYGDTFSQLSFKEAIDLEILSDYKIITLLITKEEVKEYLKQNDIVYGTGLGDSEEVDFRTYASLIALRKAMDKYPIKHAVTFHGSIKRAKLFSELQEPFEEVYPHFSKVSAYHVTGAIPTGIRSKIVREFAGAEKAIITNAKCLTEGVDVPNIDCVLFADPRNSTVDIVQAVGRALRRAGDKEFGYVLLPIYSEEKSGEALLESEDFQNILSTLRALASNDERIVEFFREKQNAKSKSGIRDLVQFDVEDIAGGININTADLIEQLELKAWSRLARLSWMTFEEGREFARALNFKSRNEWEEFSRSSRKPINMPVVPSITYKGKGWLSWGDWLGTDSVANRFKVFLPFSQAREFVRQLNLKSEKYWRLYCKSGKKPIDVPSNPSYVYKNEGWISMGDFLGTGRIADNLKVYRPFKEARLFASSLQLKSSSEWRKFCKSGMKPEDIPANPNQVYKNYGWISMGDFLGTDTIAPRLQVFRNFMDARKFAQSLGLKTVKDWEKYCRAGRKPNDIPSYPNNTYKKKGWINWGDWLGTGNLSVHNKGYLSFEDARDFVRKLGLKSWKEWRFYCKDGLKPKNIPNSPHVVYKSSGWISTGDWLGTFKIANYNREYLDYSTARQFVHKLNLKSWEEWKLFCKSGKKPNNIPANPFVVYKDKGWSNVGAWLGTNAIASYNMEFKEFTEARKFVHKLNLKTWKEWKNYCSSGLKPNDIPSGPDKTYKNEGWKSVGDWLGTQNLSNRNKVFLDFKEARSYVRGKKLRSSLEWRNFCKSPNFPDNIPTNPNRHYKNSGWINMNDWLGK